MSKLFIEFRIAWFNLVQHRRRTALLGLAIAIVTCLFVLLTSLSDGIQRSVSDAAVTLTTGHVNVNGVFKVSASQAAPIIVDYEKLMATAKSSIPELDFMVQRGRGGGKISSDSGSFSGLMNGVDVAAEPGLKKLQVSSGKLADLVLPNSILLFEQQAQALSVAVGDAVTISTETLRGVANTADCRVVAIARDVGALSAWNVFTSLTTLRALFQVRPDVTGVLQLHLKPEALADLPGIQRRLSSALEQAGYRVMPHDPRVFWEKLDAVTTQGWTGQKLDVTSWQDEVSFMKWSYGALQGLSALLLALLLAVAICGVTNTLWVAIRERTREIGTLRAIGMRRSAVARLFMLEAALLGSMGAALGGALGYSLAKAANAANLVVPAAIQQFIMRDTLELDVEPSTLILALVAMTLTVTLAAVYPAIRAARRRPVDAMGHFG